MPGPTFVPSPGPPNEAWATLNDYDATSGNLFYVGFARSYRSQPIPLAVTSVSKAAAAVVAVTAHGLQSDMTVDISGGTGDWAGINGNQKITVIDADSFSIAVNTSGYSGTFAGTITTNSPQTNAAIWSIQKIYYDGSSRTTRTAWARGTPASIFAWDSRTTYSYL